MIVTASRDGNDRGHDTTVTNSSDDAAVRQAAAQNYAIVTVTENYWDRSFDINGLSITKTEAYGKAKWVGLTGLGNIIDWGLKRTLNLDFEVKMQKTSVFELYSEHSITTKYRISTDSLRTFDSEVLQVGRKVLTGRQEWRPIAGTSSNSIIDFRVCGVSCLSLLN